MNPDGDSYRGVNPCFIGLHGDITTIHPKDDERILKKMYTCWCPKFQTSLFWCLCYIIYLYNYIYRYPGSPRPKKRMVFRMIHIKDSLLPMGKVWSLDSLGIHQHIGNFTAYSQIEMIFWRFFIPQRDPPIKRFVPRSKVLNEHVS